PLLDVVTTASTRLHSRPDDDEPVTRAIDSPRQALFNTLLGPQMHRRRSNLASLGLEAPLWLRMLPGGNISYHAPGSASRRHFCQWNPCEGVAGPLRSSRRYVSERSRSGTSSTRFSSASS